MSPLLSLVPLWDNAPTRHYSAWVLSRRGLPCLGRRCIGAPISKCRYLRGHTPHGEPYSRPSMHLFDSRTLWSCTSHTSSNLWVRRVYAAPLCFSCQVSAAIKSKSLVVYWIRSGLSKGPPQSASKTRKQPGTILLSAHHSMPSAHRATSQSSACLPGQTQQWCPLS